MWVGDILSDANRKQLWVPAGFAHGFLVLSESADVLYKTTDFYYQEYDRGIKWDDPTLAIEWPKVDEVLLSDKDSRAPQFTEAEVFA